MADMVEVAVVLVEMEKVVIKPTHSVIEAMRTRVRGEGGMQCERREGGTEPPEHVPREVEVPPQEQSVGGYPCGGVNLLVVDPHCGPDGHHLPGTYYTGVRVESCIWQSPSSRRSAVLS